MGPFPRNSLLIFVINNHSSRSEVCGVKTQTSDHSKLPLTADNHDRSLINTSDNRTETVVFCVKCEAQTSAPMRIHTCTLHLQLHEGFKHVSEQTGLCLSFLTDDGTTPEKMAHIMGPPDQCQHAVSIINDLLQSIRARDEGGQGVGGGSGPAPALLSGGMCTRG